MSNDWNEARKWVKRFDGFAGEVYQWNFKEDPGPYDFPCMWNTYLCLGDFVRFSINNEICKPYAEINPIVDLFWNKEGSMDDLPWNGGPTLWEQTTDKFGARRLKVGDDYAHSWDRDNYRFQAYNLHYMQQELEFKAKALKELIERMRK